MDWTHRLRLRHFEMLLSLGATHNISRSALLLSMSQPALSKWLKELEADIGLPLFDRRARGLRPTKFGEALLTHARRVTADLDATRADMAAMRNGGDGRLVLGTAGASIGSITPMAVLRLLDRHPHAAIELTESPMERQLKRLSSGEVDIVIGRSASDAAIDGLRTEVLYSDPVEVVARPGHPLFARDAVTWDDLLAYRWIVWPRGTPARDALDAALAAAGREVPPLSLQCGTATLNLTLVAQSDMLCFASQRDARRVADWHIARAVPTPTLSLGPVAMHWRDGEEPRPLLADMVRCLRAAARAAD